MPSDSSRDQRREDGMTILFVTNQMNVGGIETNILRLGREFCRRGHRVVVVTGGGTLAADLAGIGVPHVWAPLMEPKPQDLVAAARIVARVAASAGVDVVHNFSAPAAAATWLAFGARRLLRRRDRPAVVASPMGLGHATELRAKELVRVYVTTLGSSLVLAMSPKIREACHVLPVRRRRIVEQRIVGVGRPQAMTEHAARVALQRELGLAPSDRIVLTAGALHPRKNHELLIGAIPHVKTTDAVFLIAGEGPLRDALTAQIAAAGLNGRVRLIGERTDLDDVMVASDLYLRPGLVEGGVGTTVLHAQALGLPVVAWDTIDVRDAIDDGVTGLLVRPNDVRALAAAFDELLADPERAAALGRRGRERVAAVDGIEHVVEGLEHQYRRAIAATRAR